MNSKSTPLVSIIIPTYNHANYLKKAIHSVLCQTYKNWEAIIIDNYSKDNTASMINEYKDSRIKYYKFFNQGVIAKSRNVGLRSAKGEWLAFLDSDDWWTKDKLKNCMKHSNKNVDLIYHELETKYPKQKLFRSKTIASHKLKKPILIDLLLSTIENGNPIKQSSVLVRKNILIKIGGINEDKNLVAAEDYHTWLRIAQITDKFKYIDKKLGCIYKHESNISKKKDITAAKRIAFKDFFNFLNSQQRLNLFSKLRYESGCYNFSKKNKYKAKKDFLFVLKNGRFKLQLKSLLKLSLIIFK